MGWELESDSGTCEQAVQLERRQVNWSGAVAHARRIHSGAAVRKRVCGRKAATERLKLL